MKALIIGYGSIGRTHGEVLRTCGTDFRAIDIEEMNDIDNILSNENWDFALVCTPSDSHLMYCTKLAQRGIPFLCEKPFYTPGIGSFDNTSYSALKDLVETKELTNMVACNWRFCDAVNSIPNGIKYIKVRFGHHLAQWRNDGKHKERYSANASMGGGILWDAIHEIDYLFYKFGKIDSMGINTYRMGDVTVDSDDMAWGWIAFENGTDADFELDYLSKTYQRYYEFLDNDGFLKKRDIAPSNLEELKMYAFELYRRQMEYFIDKVKKKEKCMNDIQDAKYLIDKIEKGVEYGTA